MSLLTKIKLKHQNEIKCGNITECKVILQVFLAHAHKCSRMAITKFSSSKTGTNDDNVLTRYIKLYKIAPLPFLFDIYARL